MAPYKYVNLTDSDAHQSNNEGTQTVKIEGPVNIVDIYMPFGSMVVFMVKWAIASIPAIIILMILFAIFGGFFVSIISMFNWINLYEKTTPTSILGNDFL